MCEWLELTGLQLSSESVDSRRLLEVFIRPAKTAVCVNTTKALSFVGACRDCPYRVVQLRGDARAWGSASVAGSAFVIGVRI